MLIIRRALNITIPANVENKMLHHLTKEEFDVLRSSLHEAFFHYSTTLMEGLPIEFYVMYRESEEDGLGIVIRMELEKACIDTRKERPIEEFRSYEAVVSDVQFFTDIDDFLRREKQDLDLLIAEMKAAQQPESALFM